MPTGSEATRSPTKVKISDKSANGTGSILPNDQKLYLSVRKRLNQLGYRLPFGIDSLPLVERLFADLVHTTESLKKAKLDKERNIGAGDASTGESGTLLESYRSENTRLLRENADLHKQLVKLKADSDAQLKEMKANLRKLEHESADLKFLNNQYVHRIRVLEKESNAKSERLQELQDRNMQAVVQTPGGRKKTVPFRRQRMQLDSTVPPSESTQIFEPQKDSYVADMVALSDERIASLTRQLEDEKRRSETMEMKNDALRNEVDLLEKELARLRDRIESGISRKSHESVSLEAKTRSNERLIANLNNQIDVLLQRNSELEAELKMAASDRQYRDESLNIAEEEGQISKATITHLERLKVENEVAIQRLRTDNDMLKSKIDELDCCLRSEKEVKERLQSLVMTVQEDKAKLSGKITKLMADERELVLELQRLKTTSSVRGRGAKTVRGTGRGSTAKTVPKTQSSKFEDHLKALEDERDYWKAEVGTLQKMLAIGGGSPVVMTTPTKSKSKKTYPSPSKKRTPSSSPVRSRSLTHLAQDEDLVAKFEYERDYYKREYERLGRVVQERDELQRMLDRLTDKMTDIQAQVKIVTAERDRLSNLYETTHEELQRVRRSPEQEPPLAGRVSLATQAMIRRLEHERDDALNEMKRVASERDTLKEKMAVAQSSSSLDRRQLEQQLDELDRCLRQVEAERNELLETTADFRRQISLYQEELRAKETQLASAEEETSRQRASTTQIRLLLEQTQNSTEEKSRRLNTRENEIKDLSDQISQFTAQISSLKLTIQQNQDELGRLRNTVHSIDNEKDSLQNLLDAKTEELVTLRDELVKKETKIKELENTIHRNELDLDHERQVNEDQEHELRSCRRQLDTVQSQLKDTSQHRDACSRDVRKLHEELTYLSQEHQVVQGQLRESISEQESLKQEIQSYVMEVKRVENLLASKEQERTDLLQNYRSLSTEAEKTQTQRSQLENQNSSLKIEVLSLQSEVKRLRDRIEMQRREIDEHVVGVEAYETQNATLTRTLGQLEDQLKQLKGEKEIMLQDLQAVRDLCVKLESGKTTLQNQLDGKCLEVNKLHSMCDDFKQENNMLRSQVTQERSSVKSLETLVHQNRAKEFQDQLSAQEHQAEVQLLKDRLSLMEGKLETASREVGTLRTRCADLDAEVERLRTNLTSERFEKDRLAAEFRRRGLSPPRSSVAHRHLKGSSSMPTVKSQYAAITSDLSHESIGSASKTRISTPKKF